MNTKSKHKANQNNANEPSPNICLCNEISQAEIEKAIGRGCHTLPKIFTATTAGVGQCGGSCRPTLEKMLDYYLQNGEFLKNPSGKKQK